MKKICVGVLDSGLGGLSVLKELLNYSLGITYIYLGDNKNAPYGNKSKTELFRLAEKNVSYLKSFGADSIVFACNTLSATFLSEGESAFSHEKIFGVFPPVERERIKTEKTLLLCTNRTAERYKGIKDLTVFPLESLAADIEKNAFSLKNINVKKHLEGLNERFDTVILGCTHYFFLKNEIFDHLKPQKIYGGEQNTAKKVYNHYKSECFTCENKVLFVGENAKFNRDFFEKVVKNL